MKSVDSLNSISTTTPHLQLQIHGAQHPACHQALPGTLLRPQSQAQPEVHPRGTAGHKRFTRIWYGDT